VIERVRAECGLLQPVAASRHALRNVGDQTMSLCTRIAVTRSVVLASLVLAFAGAVAEARPRLAARMVGSSVSVSFDLQSERTDDLAQRLVAGGPVWVTWVMDVRRHVPFWVDRLVKRDVLKVTARRGRTSGVFSIERTLNGRSLSSPIDANLEETFRHLTSFANVEIPTPAREAVGAQYRLAIRVVVEGGGDARIVTPWLAQATVER
jgi:hypothetical protein